MGMLSSYHNSSTHFYRSRYEYTHQEDRMWRKNRAKTPSSLLNILGSCKGVDLNRFNSFPLVFLNFGSFPHQEFWIQVGRRLRPTWPCRCHATNHIHLDQRWIWFRYSILLNNFQLDIVRIMRILLIVHINVFGMGQRGHKMNIAGKGGTPLPCLETFHGDEAFSEQVPQIYSTVTSKNTFNMP